MSTNIAFEIITRGVRTLRGQFDWKLVVCIRYKLSILDTVVKVHESDRWAVSQVQFRSIQGPSEEVEERIGFWEIIPPHLEIAT